jgi:hypothetical protein
VRKQVEALEHQPHPLANGARIQFGLGDVLPVEKDLAIVNRLQQVDAAQDRGLAGA